MIITPIVVPMEVTVSNVNIDMSIGAEYIMTGGIPYEGSYEVTPRLYTQTLDTDQKLMGDDVTVYEIPVTRTSNLQGGQTVVIG